MRRLALWLCLVLLSLGAKAQEGLSYSLGGFVQGGYVMPTNDFVRGLNLSDKPIDRFLALSVRYTVLTSGEKPWHQLFNYPSYGLGLYYAGFNVAGELGNPIALYGFYTNDIIRKGSWRLVGDYALGIALNWTHFTLDHPERIAMGSFASCYIDAGIAFRHRVGRKTEIGLGVSFTHFSNGALVKPNKGINLLSAKLSVDYLPKEPKQRRLWELPSFDSEWVNLVSVFLGSHNVLYDVPKGVLDEPYLRRSYLVFGLDERILRRFNPKHAFGIGIGLGYDQEVGTNYRISPNDVEFYHIDHAQRFNLSAFLSYEYRIHKFGILLEPGIYLYKNKQDSSRRLFQRIGLRYFFDNGLFLSVNLRAAHFSVAQYIEWSFGYAIASRR